MRSIEDCRDLALTTRACGALTGRFRDSTNSISHSSRGARKRLRIDEDMLFVGWSDRNQSREGSPPSGGEKKRRISRREPISKERVPATDDIELTR
jgi:hypothetical protein